MSRNASKNTQVADTSGGVCEPMCENAERLAPFAESRDDGRDTRGRFAPGNAVALRDGSRSQRVAAALFPPLRAREQEIVSDLGGDVSAVRRELVERFVQASAIADSLAANIVTHGVMTGKGRTRASVTTYLQVLDRLQRLSVSIGLERRQKPTDGIREWAQRARREEGQS